MFGKLCCCVIVLCFYIGLTVARVKQFKSVPHVFVTKRTQSVRDLAQTLQKQLAPVAGAIANSPVVAHTVEHAVNNTIDTLTYLDNVLNGKIVLCCHWHNYYVVIGTTMLCSLLLMVK